MGAFDPAVGEAGGIWIYCHTNCRNSSWPGLQQLHSQNKPACPRVVAAGIVGFCSADTRLFVVRSIASCACDSKVAVKL